MPKLKRFRKISLFLMVLLALFVCICNNNEAPHREVWNRVAPHVFELIGEKGAGGTGFQLLTTDGPVIVTNSHICELTPKSGKNKGFLLVRNEDHEMVRKILKVDNTSDLCLVEPWPVKTGLTLGGNVNRGDEVVAIGHPNLDPLEMVSGQVTGQTDVVIMHHIMPTKNKAVNKFLKIPDKKCNLPKNEVTNYAPRFFSMFTAEPVPVCMSRERKAIQTDLDIYPGNSGSPLLDTSGNVVGVVFATEQNTHKGYAVNLFHLKNFLNNYKNRSK